MGTQPCMGPSRPGSEEDAILLQGVQGVIELRVQDGSSAGLLLLPLLGEGGIPLRDTLTDMQAGRGGIKPRRKQF